MEETIFVYDIESNPSATYGSGATTVPAGEYERSGTSFVKTGPWQDRPLEIHMEARAPGDLLLINRGFHWINEFPFNR